MNIVLDIGTAFGLILVIEGLLYALLPDSMRRIMAQILIMQTPQLKAMGIVMTLCGISLIYLLGLMI